MERGLPFEMKLPNEETMKAIEEAKAGTNADTRRRNCSVLTIRRQKQN